MANLLIRHGTRAAGPYTFEETERFLAEGTLPADALAWTEGLIDWTPVATVIAQLKDRVAAITPPEFTDLARRVELPDGVRGLSWAGFVIAPFWAVGNRVWIGLLALIPGLGQLVSLWLLFHGRELAWRRGGWPSLNAFRQAQRRWSIAAAIAAPLIAVLTVLVAIEAQQQRGGRPAAEAPAPAPAPREAAPEPARPVQPLQRRGAPAAEPTGGGAVARLPLPLPRAAFEAALRGRTPAEAEVMVGTPAARHNEQGVVVHVFQNATLNPETRGPDDATIVMFADGRAAMFRYAQQTR